MDLDMNKAILLLVITTSSLFDTLSANPINLDGVWGRDLRGAQATQGEFEIARDKIYWNWDGQKFLCVSDIRPVYSGKGIASPYPIFEDAKNTSSSRKKLSFVMIELKVKKCVGKMVREFAGVKDSPSYLQFSVWSHKRCPNDFYPRALIREFRSESKPSSSYHATNLTLHEKRRQICG